MNDIKEHTLSSFDEKLNDLTDSMVEMGAMVRESVRIAGTSLVNQDKSVFKEVKNNDKDINSMDEEVQRQVMEIIALMNPMAVDLRFITSALKISIALERAGDLAKNITKRMVKLKTDLPDEAKNNLEELVEIVMEMLDDALDAIKTRSIKDAAKVLKRDEDADNLCRNVFKLIRHEMRADAAESENAYNLIDVVFAAKNFERIADYATNISKTVYYIQTGETFKKSMISS